MIKLWWIRKKINFMQKLMEDWNRRCFEADEAANRCHKRYMELIVEEEALRREAVKATENLSDNRIP